MTLFRFDAWVCGYPKRHSSIRSPTALEVSKILVSVPEYLTYPRSLPCLMVKEDVTASLGFRTYWYRIWKAAILGQPHHEVFMVSPVPISPTIIISLGRKRVLVGQALQLGSSKLLHDVPWLRVENPKQRLIGKAWDLFSHFVDVVDSVTFR